MADSDTHPNLVITNVRSQVVEPAMDPPAYRKAITCVICFKLFTSMDKYEIHVTNSHSSPEVSVEASSSPTISNAIPCTTCELSFNTLFELETHNLQTHYNQWLIECPSCKRKFDLRPEDEVTSCPFCSRPYRKSRFPPPYNGGATLDLLTGNFECTRCRQCFFSKITLRDHQIAEHPEFYTGYLCRHKGCNQKFYTYDEYIHHLEKHKLKHTCEYCDKSFSVLQTLRQHLRVHTGEKPFECHQCGRAFAVKDYLTKHIRIHTGEKPYECEHGCGARFTQQSARKIHMMNACPCKHEQQDSQLAVAPKRRKRTRKRC